MIKQEAIFRLSLVLFICTLCMNCPAQTEGNYIGQRTLKFYDESRERPVITEVWYPSKENLKENDKISLPFIRDYTVRNGAVKSGKYPMIMISHGSGGGRLTLEWIAQSLAKNGFIAVAVDHWGNTYDNAIASEFIKPWERPQDISFAITEILKNVVFKNAIDTQNIGAIGYSFGGYTVIALAGGVLDYQKLIDYYTTTGKEEAGTPQFPDLWQLLLDEKFLNQTKHIPTLKDTRIDAFFSICPGTGPGFDSKEQFKDVNGPNVFIVGVAGDSVAPVEGYARNYHRLIRNSTYYEFPGNVGHYVMLNEAKEELQKEEPEAFTDDASVDRHQIHAKAEELFLDFFIRKLRKN